MGGQARRTASRRRGFQIPVGLRFLQTVQKQNGVSFGQVGRFWRNKAQETRWCEACHEKPIWKSIEWKIVSGSANLKKRKHCLNQKCSARVVFILLQTGVGFLCQYYIRFSCCTSIER